MERLPEPALPFELPFVPARTHGGNAAFHNFHNDYSHISDPNLRRRLALAEIDKASRKSWGTGLDLRQRPVMLIRNRFLSGGTMFGQLQWQESGSSQTRTIYLLSTSSLRYWDSISGKVKRRLDPVMAGTTGNYRNPSTLLSRQPRLEEPS